MKSEVPSHIENEGGKLTCKHCGETKKLKAGMDEFRFIKSFQSFISKHWECKKPKK